MTFALLLVAQVFAIGLKAIQQLNVVHGRVAWAALTSYLMSVCDVFLVVATVHSGWQLATVLTLGTGGAIGVACAVVIHRRLRGTT